MHACLLVAGTVATAVSNNPIIGVDSIAWAASALAHLATVWRATPTRAVHRVAHTSPVACIAADARELERESLTASTVALALLASSTDLDVIGCWAPPVWITSAHTGNHVDCSMPTTLLVNVTLEIQISHTIRRVSGGRSMAILALELRSMVEVVCTVGM